MCEIGAPSQPASVRFVPQEGDGWVARQTNLVRWGHNHGYARTVLVASDSPHLPAGTLADAFAALKEQDVVLGRVRDGGSYLIGVRGLRDVLSGVPLSTATATAPVPVPPPSACASPSCPRPSRSTTGTWTWFALTWPRAAPPLPPPGRRRTIWNW